MHLVPAIFCVLPPPFPPSAASPSSSYLILRVSSEYTTAVIHPSPHAYVLGTHAAK